MRHPGHPLGVITEDDILGVHLLLCCYTHPGGARGVNFNSPTVVEMQTKFSFEPDVALKESPSTDRGKSAYIAKLNDLAKLGYDSRIKLKMKHKTVIKHIESLYDDDEAGRLKKRFIVYAIFYAMNKEYLKKENAYYTYLQTINPIKVIGTGAAWIAKKDYTAPE